MTPISSPAQDSTNLDPKVYVQAVLRRKWLVLLVFLVVVGGTSLWVSRQPKVYSAAISLIFDPREPRFLDAQIQDISAETTSNYWANREYFETQVRVINSRAVSQRVVEKLGLAADPGFLGLTKIADEAQRQKAMQRMDAVTMVQGRIRVEPAKDARIMIIRIEDGDPHRAALLANEVAQAYIEETLSLKLKLTESATKWLEEQRVSLEKAASSSELTLYGFRKQADVTSLDKQAGDATMRMAASGKALMDTRLKIAELKARVAAVRSVQQRQGEDDRLWAEALPAARENQALNDYKKRLITVRTECVELQSRYLEQHPKFVDCSEKLAVAEKDYARELSNLVLATEAELKEALEKERNLQQLFQEAKTDVFAIERTMLDFDKLKKEADTAQRQYDAVFKRLKDIELSGALRISNVRVLDSARPNLGPIRPNTSQSMLLGVLAGLIGGLALALLLELLDSSVATQIDVEEKLGLAFLGITPRIASDEPTEARASRRDLHMHFEPKSIVAECMRAVRTNLLFMSPDKPFRRMLVTSSGPQEGKSTTVINLGIAMAQSGQRVLIVDTDMRRPRIHKAFKVSNDLGVSSLVVGEGKIDDCVKTTDVPGLFVLPCGPVPPNPAELLHTRAFADLLEQLSSRFDRVILDSPPVAAVADAVVLSTQVDGVVLVLRAGRTQRDLARRTVRALRDVKAPLFGAMLNDVDLARAQYGDYYYGYSYRYYGYGDKKPKEA